MNSILSEYEKNKRKYESFAKSLRSLMNSLLLAENITTHSVSYRVKERDSLEAKINSKGTYACIEDITDIVGLRIITHFSDEVDDIAKLIEREFCVDEGNTIDKRKTLEPDRFGYLSLHYIISFSDERNNLFEYKLYDGFKAEVQIRSILQHTWAEIEHDIGYKSSRDVPKFIKRQFSRLAGLLELADEEFISIRNSLDNYQNEVNNDMLTDNHELLAIDKITLREYLKSSPIVADIIKAVHDQTGTILDAEADYTGPAIKCLNFNGINSIGELETAFAEYKEKVIKRIVWVINKMPSTFANKRPYEISALYLAQIIAFTESGDKGLQELFKEANIGLNDEEIERFRLGLSESLDIPLKTKDEK